MFILQAPYPAFEITTFLPNPQLGDSVSPKGSIDFRRSMNGTKYTYVKSRDARRKCLWTFQISQHKALELQAFFDAYNSELIQVTDHLGVVYVGNFTTNPFEFEAVRRAVASPGNYSRHQIQVEFEGSEMS